MIWNKSYIKRTSVIPILQVVIIVIKNCNVRDMLFTLCSNCILEHGRFIGIINYIFVSFRVDSLTKVRLKTRRMEQKGRKRLKE